MARLINLRGHTLFDLLNQDSVVVDGGGNHGDFTQLCRERWKCSVVTVEPNERLAGEIAQRTGTTVVHAALGATCGRATFHLGENSETSSIVRAPGGVVGAVDVDVVDLATILSRHQFKRIDLLKLDIEGAEIAVLGGTDADLLRSIGQITVEFHDFCGITSPEEIANVIARLEHIGFDTIRMTTFGHGDVLFVNRDLREVTPFARFWARRVSKNLRGLGRRARKWIGR